jgi:hypothetical protein
MEGYRRPAIPRLEFRDADGVVIRYGDRWWDTPSEDLPYSVTVHPQRFAPLVDVARALDSVIPAAHRPGGAALPISIEVTAFPGAIIWVGGRDFPFPTCGCDACDEDVAQLADQMEELVDAVVEGRWAGDENSFRYWGDWGSRGQSTNPDGRTP